MQRAPSIGEPTESLRLTLAEYVDVGLGTTEVLVYGLDGSLVVRVTHESSLMLRVGVHDVASAHVHRYTKLLLVELNVALH
jgi:hypothetical protein